MASLSRPPMGGTLPDPMSKANVPDPVAAAQRVKEIARDLATDVTEGYRKSSRAFRLRAAVVGSWVLLSLLSVYTACPSSGPTNDLGAEVTLLPRTIVGQQLSVVNGSDEMWTEITLTLDEVWKHQIRTIRAGQNVVVALSKFQRDGAAAPQDLRPRSIEISCDQGTAQIPLPRQ
jgi:hypothetical protein